jgi:uncharacterized protein YbbC (DUF1343 family)
MQDICQIDFKAWYLKNKWNNESLRWNHAHFYIMRIFSLIYTIIVCLESACGQHAANEAVIHQAEVHTDKNILVGAERLTQYLPMLVNKRVAVVANQTSQIGRSHLVDSLLTLDVRIVKVFAPEHGFRGMVSAGEHISDEKDLKTGLPLVSLYGKNKKPNASMLEDVDIVVFDIQDVGARFYTYLSTMHYVMEACAENNKPLIVLDRPNPNGFYIDGPVLEMSEKSFVGMHPIPIVHGCTLGEMAQMINGEGWLAHGSKCELTVVTCVHYSHKDHYHLPIAPSPNLPNMAAVYLYPSLCLFEGTLVSVGRGTDHPFQCIGFPKNTTGNYTFVPQDKINGAMNPPYEGETCHGHFLQEFGQYNAITTKQLNLQWLLGTYQACQSKSQYFLENGFFHKLAGTKTFMQQIKEGQTEAQIRSSWQNGLSVFNTMRSKYLLYEDF